MVILSNSQTIKLSNSQTVIQPYLQGLGWRQISCNVEQLLRGHEIGLVEEGGEVRAEGGIQTEVLCGLRV